MMTGVMNLPFFQTVIQIWNLLLLKSNSICFVKGTDRNRRIHSWGITENIFSMKFNFTLFNKTSQQLPLMFSSFNFALHFIILHDHFPPWHIYTKLFINFIAVVAKVSPSLVLLQHFNIIWGVHIWKSKLLTAII